MRFNLTQRFATAALPALLATVMVPTIAIAQTRINAEVLLEPTAEEPYNVFIARAEANAAVKVQALFDQDLLRTEVRVTVLGQRSAAIAPVLRLQVSRQEWTSYPDPEIWSQYFPESSRLLSFSPPLMPTVKPKPADDTNPAATAGNATEQEAAATGLEEQVLDANQNNNNAARNGNASSEGLTIVQETPGDITPEEIKAAIEAGTLTDANFEDLTAEEVVEAIDAGELTIIKQEDL